MCEFVGHLKGIITKIEPFGHGISLNKFDITVLCVLGRIFLFIDLQFHNIERVNK